jgi:hypothetical protein
MSGQAAALLAALLVAHYAGDFSPLVTARMLDAKRRASPIGPILAHASVHGLLVAGVVALLAQPALPILLVVAGAEFGTHFAIDMGRGRLMRRFAALRDAGSDAFWRLLGLDQLAHASVLVWIAFQVV